MKESMAVDKIEELRQRSKKGEIITLLCYCEKGEHCHRYIVKSMIEGSSTVESNCSMPKIRKLKEKIR